MGFDAYLIKMVIYARVLTTYNNFPIKGMGREYLEKF